MRPTMRRGTLGGCSGCVGSEDAREAWERRLAARRSHRGRRFGVKMAVVAVMAALAAAGDHVTRTTSAPRGGGWSSHVDVPADAAAVRANTWRRAMLNERGHLASAALHGGRGAEGDPVQPSEDPCSGTTINAQPDRCAYVTATCPSDEGESLVDYRQFHYCVMDGWPTLSVAALVGVVVLAFYVLGETAEEYFCPVVRRIADVWNLAPSTAGVTLLALGNGAPDVFASLAAFTNAVGPNGAGEVGTGMIGAIVSAGMFVSGGVVGAVAIVAAPFHVEPGPFLRDIGFYLAGAVGVYLVVRSGEVRLWEALCLPGYYLAFVATVVILDRRQDAEIKAAKRSGGAGGGGGEGSVGEMIRRFESGGDSAGGAISAAGAVHGGLMASSSDDDRPPQDVLAAYVRDWFKRLRASANESGGSRGRRALVFLRSLAYAPLDISRRASIPAVDPERWNRFYAMTNVMFGPLLILHVVRDVVPWNHPAVDLGETVGYVPLWAAVLGVSTVCAGALFAVTGYRAPPPRWDLSLGLAFGTSIVWISCAATELLECLTTLGAAMGISPAILGVTVLAWGNSVGDLVADVVIARGGQPTMAVASCYAGPLFNMVMGLGLAFSLKTAELAPAPLPLLHHPNIPLSFAFLFVSLIGSLVVVPRRGYKITKSFGVALIALYAVFTACSVMVEVGVI